jgi:hypothetical protein
MRYDERSVSQELCQVLAEDAVRADGRAPNLSIEPSCDTLHLERTWRPIRHSACVHTSPLVRQRASRPRRVSFVHPGVLALFSQREWWLSIERVAPVISRCHVATAAATRGAAPAWALPLPLLHPCMRTSTHSTSRISGTAISARCLVVLPPDLIDAEDEDIS